MNRIETGLTIVPVQTHYQTAEGVTEGHPDKVCDLIADSVLDACLAHDANARVACEVLATKGHIVVAGEITCRTSVNIPRIVRTVLAQVGYDSRRFHIAAHIHQQSPDIAAGVAAEMGAGDQGIVYGYACDETAECLPLTVVLAHRLTMRLAKVRKENLITGLGADGKAQVTVEYRDGVPSRVKTVVVSTQHAASKNLDTLQWEIIERVVFPSFDSFPLDANTEVLINPSGRFVLGGPEADTGLTGRKLMVDSYGGLAPHGGGAFSGKDGTKVDRSGAYYARYIAKHIVAAGLAKRCLVSVAYAIGKAEPAAVDVDTCGTGVLPDAILRDAVLSVFCFKPASIIRELRLTEPRFAKTAVYGHFTCGEYPWEACDKVCALQKAVFALQSEPAFDSESPTLIFPSLVERSVP